MRDGGPLSHRSGSTVMSDATTHPRGGMIHSSSRLSLWPTPAAGRSGRMAVGGVMRARVGTEAVRRRERPWAADDRPEPVHLCIDATKNTCVASPMLLLAHCWVHSIAAEAVARDMQQVQMPA